MMFENALTLTFTACTCYLEIQIIYFQTIVADARKFDCLACWHDNMLIDDRDDIASF